MKKGFIVLLLSAAGFLSGHAQNQLNIWLRSGDVVSYSFAQKPLLMFPTGKYVLNEYYREVLEYGNIVLKAGNVTVEYPSADVLKYTFEKNPVSVATVRTRLHEGGDVKVYTTNGVLVKTAAAAKDGTRSFSLDDLPRGVYVVKSNSSTYKIKKQ